MILSKKTTKMLLAIPLGMGKQLHYLRDTLEALPSMARIIAELNEPDAFIPASGLVNEYVCLHETLFTGLTSKAMVIMKGEEYNVATGLNIGDLKQTKHVLRLLSSLKPTIIVFSI